MIEDDAKQQAQDDDLDRDTTQFNSTAIAATRDKFLKNDLTPTLQKSMTRV